MADIPTVPWSETTPAGNDVAYDGDNRIREGKTQVREVIGVDHDFPSSGQASDNGQHTVIHLQTQDSDPADAAGLMEIYQKEVDSVNEVMIMDDAGNAIQVTNAGNLNAVALSGNQTIAGVKTFTNAAGITLDPANIASSDFTTGQATVTNGTTSVTLVGASATATDIVAGNYFSVSGDNKWYAISTFDVDTQVLTLGGNYLGTSGSGKSYTIRPSVDAICIGGLSTSLVQTDMIADDAVTAAKIAASTVGVSQMVIGTYTGNAAATQAITGTGVDLTSGTWVIDVYTQFNGIGSARKTSSDTTSSCYQDDAAHYVTDFIISGDADGFTVGDGTGLGNYLNATGKTYVYIVIKVAA